MAKNNYVVPKELQHEYKMLIQRANRRVKANLKYIQKENITNDHTQRSLVGSFNDPVKWATGRMPFSRSNKGRYIWDADTGTQKFVEFTSERDFKQYLKHLEKWGEQTKRGELFGAHPEKIKQDYKSSIIKALNQIKDQYSISLPGGKLPKEVLKAIDSMSLEQITNFFANGDPSEDIEISQFNSDDFIHVETAEDFTDVVTSRIAAIKKFTK